MIAGTWKEHVRMITVMRSRGAGVSGQLPLPVRQRCSWVSGTFSPLEHRGARGLSPADSRSLCLWEGRTLSQDQRGAFFKLVRRVCVRVCSLRGSAPPGCLCGPGLFRGVKEVQAAAEKSAVPQRLLLVLSLSFCQPQLVSSCFL